MIDFSKEVCELSPNKHEQIVNMAGNYNNYYEAKHDNNKLRYDLLPAEWLEGLAEIATYGAKKYTDNTWQTVPDGKKRYTAAAFRHFIAWIKGEQLDSESNLHHLKHAAFNLLMLLSLERNNNETN